MFREVPLGYVDKSNEPEEEEEDQFAVAGGAKKDDKDSPLFQVDIYFQSPDSI